MITAIASDPVLDFVIIGLQNGEIMAYDLDRQSLAPLRLPKPVERTQPTGAHVAGRLSSFPPS